MSVDDVGQLIDALLCRVKVLGSGTQGVRDLLVFFLGGCDLPADAGLSLRQLRFSVLKHLQRGRGAGGGFAAGALAGNERRQALLGFVRLRSAALSFLPERLPGEGVFRQQNADLLHALRLLGDLRADRLGAVGLLVHLAAQPLHVLFVVGKIRPQNCRGGLLLGGLAFAFRQLLPDRFAFQIAGAHLLGKLFSRGVDALKLTLRGLQVRLCGLEVCVDALALLVEAVQRLHPG